MRVKEKDGPLTVRAIAGTHVVMLGMDVAAGKKDGLLGFSIHRTDVTEDERGYIGGFKTFAETDPGVGAGKLVSTENHPVQAFLWGDFTAKPDHQYTYRVEALYGTPARLERRYAATVQVASESAQANTHAVFFNRGAAASQAYARRFDNVRPDQVRNGAAFRWLSRGLEEALLEVIAQAKNEQYQLWGAFYEFQRDSVLQALAQARQRGVDVRIVFDAKKKATGPREANLRAIERNGLGDACVGREANASFISHNKFLILGKEEVPAAVWTGSTNVTNGGIFGHSNVGHLVRDAAVAAKFLAYWKRLREDDEAWELRQWNEQHAPVPDGVPAQGCTPIFSPRKSLAALEWYARQMDGAREGVFFTAAFGINKLLDEVLLEPKGYLRYCLLEKPDAEMELMERDPDNRFAVGSLIEDTELERWLSEQLTGLNTHVRYVHTKYMLIDPLGDDPLVITGSANFSDASTRNNDENMLVIRGDTRVADIYLGEFMRLFNHFRFRQVLAAVGGDARERPHLTADDAWLRPYYRPGSFRAKERAVFAGTRED
jgi:phosphatidylserine/phosphatidylglycerophosphate/cardiolipin synthase-like enzyme